MRQVITILFLLMIIPLKAMDYDNGLHFNSHSYTPDKRTSLLLNNGESIDISGEFVMEFSLDLRDEPMFGNIFCIKTDNGHHIDVLFSALDQTTYNPAIACDGRIQHLNYVLRACKDVKVGITMNTKKGTIVFSYGKSNVTVDADIKGSRSAVITFGKHTDENNYNDVAPMNVRNISIARNGKNKYLWPLSAHKYDVCVDALNGKPARAINGKWIYDNHVDWKLVTSFQSTDRLQVAYDDVADLFYIVDKDKVRCFDPNTKKNTDIAVKGGYRVMDCSNYIFFDHNDNTLANYSSERGNMSKFDVKTGVWSCKELVEQEPMHSNHAWARANDSISYTFGGYGFYRFVNNLYRINQNSGEVQEVRYSPKFSPRTGCSAAIVGDRMYIFGGFGNESGQQELPGHYYYDLVSIDLKSGKSETVWEVEAEQNTSFQMASEMYYDREKRAFYAATTNKGGRLIRISLDEPRWDIVTNEINTRFDFKDMNFNLFESQKHKKLYVVINKCKGDNIHDILISSIDLPLQDDYVPDMEKWTDSEAKSGMSLWWWLVIALVVTITMTITIARLCHLAQPRTKTNTKTKTKTEAESDVVVPEVITSGITPDEPSEEEPEAEEPQQQMQPGTITLLGNFAVTDKDGNDITSSFSKRLRDLLMIIILYNQKNSKGIEMREIDDNIWQNMSELSARNNRNVNISKLRMLLEKVGDAEINNDKIYYQIRFGNNVSCDYVTTMKLMKKVNDGQKDEKTIARTLQQLLKGPLVPNISYEWLDPFKAQYSEAALALLNSLLWRAERDGNDNQALQIAETIMQHDPFNDKALAVQCTIHCRNNRKGIAKKEYDNFCKVYQHSMGEPYYKSFMEVTK